MKIAEVRELKTKELEERVQAEAARLNQMELQHCISPLDNPAQIKFARRDIARLNTILRERMLNKQN